MPGSLRIVFDCNVEGERWMEWHLLQRDEHGLFLKEVSVQQPGLRGVSDSFAGCSGLSAMLLVDCS